VRIREIAPAKPLATVTTEATFIFATIVGVADLVALLLRRLKGDDRRFLYLAG
jgi:hypothetical protein